MKRSILLLLVLVSSGCLPTEDNREYAGGDSTEPRIYAEDAGYADGQGGNDPRNVVAESDALPVVDAEDMGVPDAPLPDADVPDVTPDMDVPDVPLPDADVPDVTPDMDVSDAPLPDADVPDVTPDMDAPDAPLPDADVPDVTPDMDVPDAPLPDADVPDVIPDMDVPDAEPNPNPYDCDDNGTEDLIVLISATGDELVTVHYEYAGQERNFGTRPHDPEVRVTVDLCNLPVRFWVEGGSFSLNHNYQADYRSPGLSYPEWPEVLPSSSRRNGVIRSRSPDPVNIHFDIPNEPIR